MQTHQLFQLAFLLSPIWTHNNGFISASPLHLRQSTTCADPSAAFDTSCWSTLNVGDFLTNTTTGWNSSTGSGRPCKSGDNAAYCCRSTESWSTCFMRQSLELANKHFECGALNSTTCPADRYDFVTEVPKAGRPEHRYVLRNIYSIFQLFTSWQKALPQAITDAGANLEGLISEVDPSNRVSVNQSSTLQSFLLGFPLLASPTARSLITPQLHPVTNTSAQALLQGLQHVPEVVRALYPGNTESASLKLSDVSSYLALNETRMTLNGLLDNASRLLMSDLGLFAGFADSGLFSGAGDFGVDGDDQGLDVGVESFVMSAAEQDQKYKIMVEALGIGLKP